MRVIVLSRSGKIPSTKLLVETARGRGHQVRVLNPVLVEMHLAGTKADLFYGRKRLSSPDVVLPRIAQSISDYGLAVLNQFCMRDIPTLNSAGAIATSRNKMGLLQLLSKNGLSIPATVMARNADDLKDMVSLVGGVPVLVKVMQGQGRHGVMVCESLQSLAAALEAILGLGHNLVVQQYVKKSGHDLRVLVVGGRAVAAVRRKAKAGRLTKALIRGARLEKTKLNSAQESIAVRAAEVVGLDVAAVDILDVHDGPKVFEVNSSPALDQMAVASGVNLALEIIKRLEKIAGREEMGVKPRPGRFSNV